MVSFRDFVFTVSTFSDISETIPALTWIIFARKKMPYNILGVFFLVSSLLKIYTLITAELHITNMQAFHLMACWEIVMFYLFYLYLLRKQQFRWGILILIGLCVADTIYLEHIMTFNALAWSMDMIMIISMGMLYFFRLYQKDETPGPLTKRPDFIIIIGLLIYASGSLFPYLLANKILTGSADGFFKNAWFFQTLSNISKNIIVSYGFLLTRRYE